MSGSVPCSSAGATIGSCESKTGICMLMHALSVWHRDQAAAAAWVGRRN